MSTAPPMRVPPTSLTRKLLRCMACFNCLSSTSPFRVRGWQKCSVSVEVLHSQDASCARLAREFAPASRPGKKAGWRHGRRCQYRGYRGGGRYVGPWRQLRPGADLSFDCGRARACGQQDCLRHHERLLRDRRTNDGFCFHTRKEGSSEFLFRPSGHYPNVSTSSIEAVSLWGLTTQTDESTVTRLHLSRTFRPTWPTSHRVCSSVERGSFIPIPFGRTSNNHPSDSDSCGLLGEKNLVPLVCSRQHKKKTIFRAHVLVFSCAESSLKCLCASSWRPRIALKSLLPWSPDTPPSWSPFYVFLQRFV